MKNLFLLISLSVLLIGTNVLAQQNKLCETCFAECRKACNKCEDSKYLLIYDFQCKKLKLLRNGTTANIDNLRQLKIRYNQEFRFRIVNINRYLYDVNFQADDVQLNNEPSPLFKNLFLGEGSIDKLIAGFGIKAGDSTKEDVGLVGPPSALDVFINSFREFKVKYDALLDDKVTVYRYCLPDLKCACKDDKFSELSSSLLQVKLDYANAKKELTKQMSDFEKCTKENKENESKIAELDKSIAPLSQKKDELDKRIRKVANDSDAAKKLRKEIKALVDKITSLEKKRDNIRIENCGDEVTEEVVKQIDKLGTYLDSIKEEGLMSLILFHNSMVADHLEFNSSPIFPQGNRLKLGIGFNPTTNAKQANFMPMASDSIGLDIPVILKPFLTFSSGLFYSYIPQDSYGTKQIPFKGIVSDTSRFVIAKTGSRNATAGFSALANLGMKFTGNFGAGVSLGVGVTIEDTPKPTYLAGLSTYWGDRKQLNFTFGLSAIPTKSLKTELYPDLGTLLYKTAPLLQYTDTMKTGWFFSITYAFFNPEVTKNSKSK